MKNLEERNILDIAQEMQKRSAALNEMLKAEGMKNYLNFALQFNRNLAAASFGREWEEQVGGDDESGRA